MISGVGVVSDREEGRTTAVAKRVGTAVSLVGAGVPVLITG